MRVLSSRLQAQADWDKLCAALGQPPTSAPRAWTKLDRALRQAAHRMMIGRPTQGTP